MAANTTPTLKFFKLHDMVNLPTFATEGSACFDLAYSYIPRVTTHIKGFNSFNGPIDRQVGPTGKFTISPGDRLLVPTGIIMDIPNGYSVRIHPRSGLSIKKGITLPNCEGVIDWDYTDESVITVINHSEIVYDIEPGDRLAQGEMIKMLSYNIDETTTRPTQKTTRVGGHGSTGK